MTKNKSVVIKKVTLSKNELKSSEKSLLLNLQAVLKIIFPNGKFIGGDFRVGDVYGNSGDSLSVCLIGNKKGLWFDHATNQSGNILKLIASRFELDLATNNQLLLNKVKEILLDIKLPSTEIVQENKVIFNKESHSIEKVAEWDYLSIDGSYLHTIIRFEDACGKKSIRPYNKVTKEYKGCPELRPLYNLPNVNNSDKVIIVEGEKCAQALIDNGYCATTAMMGAKAPASKTDWMPLANKHILIWPDNDEAGMQYAFNCAEAVLAAGAKDCAIFSIPPEKPNGWDVADALMNGSNFDLKLFLDTCEKNQFTQKINMKLLEAFDEANWRTEDEIATVFTKLYGLDWKYSTAWGQWYSWNGQRWVQDNLLRFSYEVRAVCRVASGFANIAQQNLRAKIASASTVSNIDRLVRADPNHAISTEKWDADPMLLNTTGGIINLVTGQIYPHDRNKYLTKSTTALPTGECIKWLEFLSDITNGNKELISYLQRVIGYCLTGLTSEHALFFLYGTGANGKSVFLNVISAILGDYAKTAPMETFMDTRSDRHPTDLAGLRGARLVCAIETEQGRRWNESKIKAITGGDTISARFMRQDFFEFKPQFKLLIAGNHKPSISNVDEAMSRRIHLIPFTTYIPPEKRDKQLTDKLLNERDGILAWAVKGLLSWQELKGLNPPNIVTEATKEYLNAEDAVGRWLEDCCEIDNAAFTSSKFLFESWKNWANEFGEYIGSIRKLSDQLIAKKFKPIRENQVRGFKGLYIKENSNMHFFTNSKITNELSEQL